MIAHSPALCRIAQQPDLPHNGAVKAVLISTYEMGRQPFGLASAAAWLRRAGTDVTCLDVSRQPLDEEAVRKADLVAFYVPMHTATRLAVQLLEPVRQMNPRAHVCFYGLYAPVNESFLRGRGVQTILGGEFEAGLAALAERLCGDGHGCPPSPETSTKLGARVGTPLPEAFQLQPEPAISLERQQFVTPQRAGLPALEKYAHVVMPEGGHRVAGYTEASRGCKHLCRHCPIVPVYNGVFRVVQPGVVLADVRQQVAAGAQHITFGDPDFFNGPTHGLGILQEMHREFPALTYDVTIKVEHLLKHAQHLATLRDTGCLFVTTAVESVDDAVLEKLEKGHTRADFLRVVELFRKTGLALQPTFVPFTPWTRVEGYVELLRVLAEQQLVAAVAPIQLAIRLLIPAGSRLLELPEVRGMVGPFDAAGLVYPWKHADPRMDTLCDEVQEIARSSEKVKHSRAKTFARIWEAAAQITRLGAPIHARGRGAHAHGPMPALLPRAAVPYLNEPWYC